METKLIFEHLETLIALDVNLFHAYSDALLTVDVPEVRNRLVSFKSDHEKHATVFSNMFRQLSGKPVTPIAASNGHAVGTERALKSLRAREILAIKKYEHTLSEDLPGEIKQVLQGHLDDERRHLQYIEQCIEQCVWEPSDIKTA